jgi:hypothetical protein
MKTNGTTNLYRRLAESKRRMTSGMLLLIDDQVEDAITLASIRETARLFGSDRVRGL